MFPPRCTPPCARMSGSGVQAAIYGTHFSENYRGVAFSPAHSGVANAVDDDKPLVASNLPDRLAHTGQTSVTEPNPRPCSPLWSHLARRSEASREITPSMTLPVNPYVRSVATNKMLATTRLFLVPASYLIEAYWTDTAVSNAPLFTEFENELNVFALSWRDYHITANMLAATMTTTTTTTTRTEAKTQQQQNRSTQTQSSSWRHLRARLNVREMPGFETKLEEPA